MKNTLPENAALVLNPSVYFSFPQSKVLSKESLIDSSKLTMTKRYQNDT
jgi:hypothetical protein